ncbi:MAG: hypothetical protein AAF502_05125 [Bacteroidota bacterium]
MTSLSYTGFNFSLGVTAEKDKFSIYVGPKLTLSDSYLVTDGPFGFSSSFFFFPNGRDRKFSSFINFDYQVNFQKAFCPTGTCSRKTNFTHEYNLGYGFVYQVKRVGLMNAINIGRYSENFYNQLTQQRFKNSGYNTLIKIGVIVNVQKQDAGE